MLANAMIHATLPHAHGSCCHQQVLAPRGELDSIATLATGNNPSTTLYPPAFQRIDWSHSETR